MPRPAQGEQAAERAVPFGGAGDSGMGCYHGKRGIDTVGYEKGMVDKSIPIDFPPRYMPYTALKAAPIRYILR